MDIVETLTAQTQTLRTQYLEKTAEYAVDQFARITKLANSPYPVWSNFQSEGWTTDATTHQDYNPAGVRAIDYQQGIRYRKACDARHNACNTIEKGFEVFAQKLESMAIRHYEDSIIKLAARIVKKGLIQNSITIKTSHIGVNIETVLTDSVKTVRAWTIIASGPCVRPHYRYLIK